MNNSSSNLIKHAVHFLHYSGTYSRNFLLTGVSKTTLLSLFAPSALLQFAKTFLLAVTKLIQNITVSAALLYSSYSLYEQSCLCAPTLFNQLNIATLGVHSGTLRSSATNKLVAASARLAGYYDNTKHPYIIFCFEEFCLIGVVNYIDESLQPGLQTHKTVLTTQFHDA